VGQFDGVPSSRHSHVDPRVARSIGVLGVGGQVGDWGSRRYPWPSRRSAGPCVTIGGTTPRATISLPLLPLPFFTGPQNIPPEFAELDALRAQIKTIHNYWMEASVRALACTCTCQACACHALAYQVHLEMVMWLSMWRAGSSASRITGANQGKGTEARPRGGEERLSSFCFTASPNSRWACTTLHTLRKTQAHGFVLEPSLRELLQDLVSMYSAKAVSTPLRRLLSVR